MYRGNPHQDRNPFKSFTGGFQQGWRDRRPPAVPLPIDTMERGGTPAVPMPKVTGAMPGTIPKDIMRGPLYGGGRWENPNFPNEPKPFINPPPEKFWNDGTLSNNPNMLQPLGDQASYSPSERVYPKFMIDSLLQQGSIMQSEIKQIAPDSFQVTPRGMDPKPLRPTEYYTMNKGLDNWGGNLGGTFDQPGYGDPSWGNRWGGYYTQDNFDPYDDDVLDPGGGEHAYGPLFLG